MGKRTAAEKSGFGEPPIVAWGSYDEGKPRVRLLLHELRQRGALLAEINIPAWTGIEDKSGATARILFRSLVRLLIGYPRALLKLFNLPARCAILLPYPGIPDTFVVWPLAKLRRQPILLDAFLPLYDTVVGDRALLSPTGWRGRFLFKVEGTALGLADIVLVDTDQHGDYFAKQFGLDRRKIQTVLVGAEPLFTPRPPASPDERTNWCIPTGKPFVLFYGQFIPLHGLTTILDAVRLTQEDSFHWVIIGRGQEERLMRQFMADEPAANLTWIPWLDYSRLPAMIASAKLGLGIFGTSAKAARVIPNKMFQILHAGKPVITRSSPAVEEVARRFPDSIVTVPPGDGAALADTVREVMSGARPVHPLPPESARELGPSQGVEELLARLRSA